jgi:PAS domain S-box-containing protein
MSQQVNRGHPGEKDTRTDKVPAGGNMWAAACLFAAGAFLYFADITLTAIGISAPDWQEYFINRGLFLILFAVPLLYCSYAYRIRGVIASLIIYIVLFGLRAFYEYPDMLPFYKSLTFTAFLMVLGLLIARYQNIRDRERQATRMVAASERRYRALTENVADLIWNMDMDMRLHCIYVNPAVTQLSDYTVGEAAGLTIGDILSPDSVEQIKEVINEETKAGDPSQNADPHHVHVMRLFEKHRDGSLLPVEVKVIILRDSAGKPTEILGVTRLIKKRLAAE